MHATAAEEHGIAVATMRAAARARRLRTQCARARTAGERHALRQQAEVIENEIILVANLLLERDSLWRARA